MNAMTEKQDADIDSKAMAVSNGDATPYIDPAQEKKLLRKMDLYLAPLMTIICQSTPTDVSHKY
jgi:hypothetical protein